jgi:hypothetical protein
MSLINITKDLEILEKGKITWLIEIANDTEDHALSV